MLEGVPLDVSIDGGQKSDHRHHSARDDFVTAKLRATYGHRDAPNGRTRQPRAADGLSQPVQDDRPTTIKLGRRHDVLPDLGSLHRVGDVCEQVAWLGSRRPRSRLLYFLSRDQLVEDCVAKQSRQGSTRRDGNVWQGLSESL